MYLVSADVGSLAVKGAVQEVVRQIGHVDVLVNCAGTFHTAPLHETPPEKYEVRWTQVSTLTHYYLFLLRALTGSIVFTSCVRRFFV